MYVRAFKVDSDSVSGFYKTAWKWKYHGKDNSRQKQLDVVPPCRKLVGPWFARCVGYGGRRLCRLLHGLFCHLSEENNMTNTGCNMTAANCWWFNVYTNYCPCKKQGRYTYLTAQCYIWASFSIAKTEWQWSQTALLLNISHCAKRFTSLTDHSFLHREYGTHVFTVLLWPTLLPCWSLTVLSIQCVLIFLSYHYLILTPPIMKMQSIQLPNIFSHRATDCTYTVEFIIACSSH